MAVSGDQIAVPVDLSAVLVQRQVADVQGRRVGGDRELRTEQQRAQPQHQFLDGERFGHVVVATRGQAGDPVLDRITRGQEKHRNVVDLRPDAAEHLHAVHVRQHDVQNDQIRPELASGGDGGLSVARQADVPTLEAQRQADEFGQSLLVVDDEGLDGSVAGSRAGTPGCCRWSGTNPAKGAVMVMEQVWAGRRCTR